jgi:hypothetical protein
MRDKGGESTVLAMAAFVTGGLLLACIAWIASSSFEASTYNRLTGGHATTWDAMFTELRVVGMEQKP